MHVPPPRHASVNPVTGITVGPVNVLLAGVAKSTWNLNRLSELVVAMSTKKFRDPAGGAVLPSRSEGRRLATLDACWKQTWVAAAPASMAVRSYAHASAPWNVFVKMLKLM